ncbi:MAG: CPBP family intramembrane glutamic endopeptidase [Thermodesulfobacteriota bacterium]|nr:CPBP family intramembrane glutamic endopeptidase [Thermodesulfobacteriota bacterium]
MDTREIRLRTVVAAGILVLGVEGLMRMAVTATVLPAIAVMAAGRCVQTVLMLGAVVLFEHTLAVVGLYRSFIGRGVRAGVAWSVGFGGVVSIGGVGLMVGGINPLGFFSIHPLGPTWEVGLFYFTGAALAPIAEEVLFRGMVYGYFRRFGVVRAIVITTVVFTALHLTTTTVPIIQAVGGILFCIAYEKEKNLMVPIVIHMMGNGAIFLAGLVP